MHNACRFDEHETFRCKDAEVELPFLDNLDNSPVAWWFWWTQRYFKLIYVHFHLRPHSWIEITMREVSKKMFVLEG